MNKSNRRAKYVRQDAANEAGENTNQIRGVTPGRRVSSDPERVREVAQKMMDDGDLPGWAVFESKLQCCPSDVLVYDTIEDMQSGTYYEWGNDVAEQSVSTFENPNPITYFPQEGQMCIVPGPRGGIFTFKEETSTNPSDHPVEDGGLVFGAGQSIDITRDITLRVYAGSAWENSTWTDRGTIGGKSNLATQDSTGFPSAHTRKFSQEVSWEIKNSAGEIVHTSDDYAAGTTSFAVPEGTYTLVMRNTSDGISLPTEDASYESGYYDEGGDVYYPDGIGWNGFGWNLVEEGYIYPGRTYPRNSALVAAGNTRDLREPDYFNKENGQSGPDRDQFFRPGEGLEKEIQFEVQSRAKRTGHNHYNGYWLRETGDNSTFHSRWWYNENEPDEAKHINQMFASSTYDVRENTTLKDEKAPGTWVISPGAYTCLTPVIVPMVALRRFTNSTNYAGRREIIGRGAKLISEHYGAGLTTIGDYRRRFQTANSMDTAQNILEDLGTAVPIDIDGLSFNGPLSSVYDDGLLFEDMNVGFEDWYDPNEVIETTIVNGSTNADNAIVDEVTGEWIGTYITNNGHSYNFMYKALRGVASHYSSVGIELFGSYAVSIISCSGYGHAVGIRTILGLMSNIKNCLIGDVGFAAFEPQQGSTEIVEPYPHVSAGPSGETQYLSAREMTAGEQAALDKMQEMSANGEEIDKETLEQWSYIVPVEFAKDDPDSDPENPEQIIVPGLQVVVSNTKNYGKSNTGCTDHYACNFDPEAPWDDAASHSDGTCVYPFANHIKALEGCYDCAGNMIWRDMGSGMGHSNSQSNVLVMEGCRHNPNSFGGFAFVHSQSNGLYFLNNVSEGKQSYYGIYHRRNNSTTLRGLRSEGLWCEQVSGGNRIRGKIYANNNYNFTSGGYPHYDKLFLPEDTEHYGQYVPGRGMGDGWAIKIVGTTPNRIGEAFYQYTSRILWQSGDTAGSSEVYKISYVAGKPPYFGGTAPGLIHGSVIQGNSPPALDRPLGQYGYGVDSPSSYDYSGLQLGSNSILNDNSFGIGSGRGNVRITTAGIYKDVVFDAITSRKARSDRRKHTGLRFEMLGTYSDTSDVDYITDNSLPDNTTLYPIWTSARTIFRVMPVGGSIYVPSVLAAAGAHTYTGQFDNRGQQFLQFDANATHTLGDAVLIGRVSLFGNAVTGATYEAGFDTNTSVTAVNFIKIRSAFSKTIPASAQAFHGGATTVDASSSAELWMFEKGGANYTKLKAEETLGSNFTITVPGITGTMMLNVVEDTAPQLGGPLDVNGQIITSASNGDITLDPDGTGSIIFKSDDIQFQTATAAIAGGDFRLYESSLLTPQNFIAIQAPASVTADTTLILPDGAGSNGQVLSTNGSGTLSWLSVLTATNPTINNTLSLQSLDGVNAAQILIYDLDGSNYVRVGVNSNLTSNVDFILPTSNGSSGQVLATNGSGVLSYVDQTTDTNTNLGNSDLTLAAERTVEMGSNALVFENTSNVVAKIWPAGYVQGKGRLIVEGTSVVGGVVRFWDADNSNYIDLQAPTTVSSNEAFVLPAADGSAGEFLKTDGSGNLSFAAAGGSSVVTDPFNSTSIKVLPHQFQINDDAGRPLFVEDDTANTLGVRCFGSSDEMYAFVKLPSGYKATHVHVYASASTTNAATILSYNFTTGATNNVASTTINLNANTAITEIAAASGQDLVIKVAPGASTTIIFGAAVTIATV